MSPADGWHALRDGRDGLWREGTCVGVIAYEPGRDPPYATESWSPGGVRSLRNLPTLEATKAHCERIADLPAEGRSQAAVPSMRIAGIACDRLAVRGAEDAS